MDPDFAVNLTGLSWETRIQQESARSTSMQDMKDGNKDAVKRSKKRKAAEAALASLYTRTSHRRLSPQSTASMPDRSQLEGLTLASCDDNCMCYGDAASGNLILDMEEGVRAILVDSAEGLSAGLSALRGSMQDPVVAIDLEWKPDRFRGSNNKVAMIQLASTTVALLIRTCQLGYRLGEELHQFLRDPGVVLVGFSWDASDEKKCMRTFKVGRSIVPTFLDLQVVGGMLGYKHFGLAALSKQVLGVEMPKSREVTMSDWEASRLEPDQVVYAALDALVTGAVFRALRMWHSMPSECAACTVPLGTVVPLQKAYGSPDTAKRKRSLNAYSEEASLHKVRTDPFKCQSCGRQTSRQ